MLTHKQKFVGCAVTKNLLDVLDSAANAQRAVIEANFKDAPEIAAEFGRAIDENGDLMPPYQNTST